MTKKLAHLRDLVSYLVVRNLRIRYRRSAIGFGWTMLQPLLTMLVLHAVFSSIFRFNLAEGSYPVFALSGILFWNFFSQSITTSMNSLKGNAGLFTKVPVAKEVFPLATVLAGVVNLGLAFVPLLAILAITGHPIRPSILFVPVAVLIATLFTLGAGLLLSPLAVFFVDTVETVNVGLMLAFYLTPVFYPMSIVPEHLRWVVRFNPLRSILEVFRDPIFYGKVPPLTHLAVATAVALGTLLLGWTVFRRTSNRIPYYI